MYFRILAVIFSFLPCLTTERITKVPIKPHNLGFFIRTVFQDYDNPPNGNNMGNVGEGKVGNTNVTEGVLNTNETAESLTPQCFEYSPSAINISEWDNAPALGWIVNNEFGTQRLTHKTPIKNAALVLKNLKCEAAKYKVRVRLEQAASAGIVFRTQKSDDVNKMVVGLNTIIKTIALTQIRDGVPETLEEKSFGEMNPQFLHEIEVIDHGSDGLIEVNVDGRLILTQYGVPYFEAGSFGPWLGEGSAVFSSLSAAPL